MAALTSHGMAALRVTLSILRWSISRLLTFVGLVAFLVPILFLRTGVVPRRGQLPTFQPGRYWPALRQYVEHLLDLSWGPLYQAPRGGWIPPEPVISQAQIGEILARNVPLSLLLFTAAFLTGLAAGVLFGFFQSRFGPRVLRPITQIGNMVTLSIPDILLVISVQFGLLWLTPRIGFELLPMYGARDASFALKDLALPVLLLSVFPATYVGRIAGAAFDEVFGQDYMRTARAKGLPNRQILWKHAFRNALTQILTGVPAITGLIISNLIILEFLMNLSGIGRMMTLEFKSQHPSANLIASAAICFAALFVVIDGIADGLLKWIDPRIQDQERRPPPAVTDRSGLSRFSGASNRGIFTVLHELWHGVQALWQRLREVDLREAVSRLGYNLETNPPLLWGSLITLLLLVLAFIGPALAPHPPDKMTPILMQSGRFLQPPYPPMPEFPFGSDEYGRDIFSRLLHGVRYTLLIAALIVPLRAGLGLLFGMAAGWLGGVWEWGVRRLATFFGAIPALVIPVLLVKVIFVPPLAASMGNPNPPPPPNPFHVLVLNSLILVMIGWPRLAESFRLMTREFADRPFVEGARAAGASDLRILLRHILPHLLPRLTVIMVAEMAWVMLLLSQLALFEVFLGGSQNIESIGQVSQYSDWSHMLSNPTRYLFKNQRVLLIPATAYFIAIFGFHLLAEGIRRSGLQRGLSGVADIGFGPARSRRSAARLTALAAGGAAVALLFALSRGLLLSSPWETHATSLTVGASGQTAGTSAAGGAGRSAASPSGTGAGSATTGGAGAAAATPGGTGTASSRGAASGGSTGTPTAAGAAASSPPAGDLSADALAKVSGLPDLVSSSSEDGTVTLVYTVVDPFDEQDFVEVSARNAVSAMEKLFAVPGVKSVTISAQMNVRTAPGRKTLTVGTTITWTQRTLAKIDWPEIEELSRTDYRKVFMVSDRYRILPAIHLQLQDSAGFPRAK